MSLDVAGEPSGFFRGTTCICRTKSATAVVRDGKRPLLLGSVTFVAIPNVSLSVRLAGLGSMRVRRFDGFDCSSLTAEIFNQRHYIFYYIEDMKRILLPVIVCRGR